MFGIYAIYAAPTPEQLTPLPVVKLARTIAQISVGVLAYNALVIVISLVGLLKGPAWLFEVMITLFSIEVVAMPLLVAIAISRMMP